MTQLRQSGGGAPANVKEKGQGALPWPRPTNAANYRMKNDNATKMTMNVPASAPIRVRSFLVSL